MTIDTTRRAFMAAIPASAVVAAIPAAALAASPADRRAWDFAMARYQREKAEGDAYDETLLRIHDAWDAGRPSYADMIDWRAFPGSHQGHIAHGADLDGEWQWFLQGEGKRWFGEEAKAEYRAALDSVQAYRDAKERYDEESGLNAANQKSEALTDRMVEALDTLMGTPAPDLAALRWKLNYLSNDGDYWDSFPTDYGSHISADIARLLPEGR